jgi:exopolysaccharide biosynthesis polyprenyl glycosylphosphotransferase
VHRVLVIGDELHGRELVSRLKAEPAAGFVPVAACLAGASARWDSSVVGVPVLGTPADAASAAATVTADVVAVAAGPAVTARLVRDLAWSLEGTGVDLVVSPALTDVAGPRIDVRPVAGLPLLYVDEPRLPAGRNVVKTVMDLVGATVGLLLLSPLLLAIGLLIRLTSPGPVLFRQNRVGLHGEQFRVLKFRTMYQDAEARLVDLRVRNEADGLLFKIKDDPRVTPLGRWLRGLSLDELPQLGNVLLGQMSLVGPRPLPVLDSDVTGDARRRLLVRPGITGLWQVSGRSDVTWEEAVRLDLHYVANWSVSLDLLILLRTVAVVLRRRGAY